MTRIPASALVQMLGAVLLLGSSWPITRYALLGGAAPFWFALGRAGLSATAATVVLAEIDPLRSEGEMVAERLAAAGALKPGQPGEGTAGPVQTEARLFQGTAHGFFGLGSTVPEAAAAEDYAATRLKAAFYRPAPREPAGRARHRRAAPGGGIRARRGRESPCAHGATLR